VALLIPIAFVVGIVTVFTPCILPVLPIVLASGGTADTKRRPYAIVVGLVTTFTLFTLAGAWIWSELHVPSKYQIKVGAVLLLALALMLIVPQLGRWIEQRLAFLTRRRTGDLGGGFLLGASLGLVFVPCAGPLLGVLAANVGTHRVGASTVVVFLAYALGVALPMFAIAQGSRRVSVSFRSHAQTVRLAGGVLMAAAAVVIYEGWLTNLQTKVPSYAVSFERWIEGGHTVHHELARLQGRDGKPRFGSASSTRTGRSQLASKPIKVALPNYGAAPDFHGISRWLNTPGDKPLTVGELRGRVVLIDFWTYSCINCLRTLPHLEAWDKEYRSKGLVIVGVHTPEFAFEHDYGNVSTAVRQLHVHYPVAMDNDYGTWNAYSNQYWPAEYLIDQHGDVRDEHFGEGEYSNTEHDIRLLLKAGGTPALPAPVLKPNTTPTAAITPESYLGYFRLARYAGSPIAQNVEADYRFPKRLGSDDLAYAGRWLVQSEKIVAVSGARLRLNFHAQSVHLVLGGRGVVGVAVDGRKLAPVRVTEDRLYRLASFSRVRDGLLELSFTPGVQAYSFTFG